MSSKFVRLSDRVVINTDHIVWYALYEVDGYAARLHLAGEREPMTLNVSERAALEKHLFGGKEDGEDVKQSAPTVQAEPKEQPFHEWARSLGMYVADDTPYEATAVAGTELIRFYCGHDWGVNITLKKADGKVNDVAYNVPRETARQYLVDLDFVKE